MEHKSGTFNNLLIEDIILEDASEDWLDDTFIVVFTFQNKAIYNFLVIVIILFFVVFTFQNKAIYNANG